MYQTDENYLDYYNSFNIFNFSSPIQIKQNFV